jgi:predicted Zn-dependent peptidase
MSKIRAGAIALAAAGLFVLSCQTDQQEAQKFDRADAENFRRDMSAMSTFTLANGVTVYVQEERTDDRVAIEVLYPAGFMVEPKGEPQISHLTEHMAIYCAMGAFAPDAALAAIQKDRGMLNAEAVADFVHIDYIVAGTRLEEVFQIESDRLRGITCDQPTLTREAGKVVAEIDNVMANPKGVLTKFAMMAFNQTYRFGQRHVPVRAKVAEFTIDDVHRFHVAHYRPNDMVIVVIGNVKTADVEALARKYFEPVPRRPAAEMAQPVLAKNTSATWDIGTEVVYLFAPGPYPSDRERLILTMFGAFLHQSMNTTQEVYGACRALYCSNQVYRVADLPFFIFAEPTTGRSASDVSGILLDHVDRAVAMLDDDALVANVKGSMVSFISTSMLKPDVPDYPMAHHQVIGQEALNVGMKHLLREGRSAEDFAAEVNAITADDVRATVRKHVARDKLVQITFGPRT